MANVLFVSTDDMGGTMPGAFGGPRGVIPALDFLASEGPAFLPGHVATAACQPSRSPVMTGRWPHRNATEGFEPIYDGLPLLTAFGRVRTTRPHRISTGSRQKACATIALLRRGRCVCRRAWRNRPTVDPLTSEMDHLVGVILAQLEEDGCHAVEFRSAPAPTKRHR